MMTRDDALQFAAGWIEAWNRRDIEQVLAAFDDAVEFTSPRAVATVGVATVHGKQELRAYWKTALVRISSLRFVLDRALWDPERRELAIVYVSQVNDDQRYVSENFCFGPNGKVCAVDVFHGVVRLPKPARAVPNGTP